jgi:hypothetical protein
MLKIAGITNIPAGNGPVYAEVFGKRVDIGISNAVNPYQLRKEMGLAKN